jgi:hypothetical protein
MVRVQPTAEVARRGGSRPASFLKRLGVHSMRAVNTIEAGARPASVLTRLGVQSAQALKTLRLRIADALKRLLLIVRLELTIRRDLVRRSRAERIERQDYVRRSGREEYIKRLLREEDELRERMERDENIKDIARKQQSYFQEQVRRYMCQDCCEEWEVAVFLDEDLEPDCEMGFEQPSFEVLELLDPYVRLTVFKIMTVLGHKNVEVLDSGAIVVRNFKMDEEADRSLNTGNKLCTHCM